MPKFNDLDLENWKDIELDMNSLWIINKRKTWWKHSNFYHWNFIPQIPNHFIQRYTKKWWWVFDPFLWSATTAIECEELWRHIIWIDIQEDLINRAKDLIDSTKINAHFWVWDSKSEETRKNIETIMKHKNIEWLDLALLQDFSKVLDNTHKVLKKWWYMIIVIWDKYQNSEWIPLWFQCMAEAQNIWFKLKSVIVKNMEWNRGKAWSWWIRQYRALNSDYYIFKHEYILVFKK